MSFSAPSPASSSDSFPIHSPQTMSSDLGLDPSDPLNLMLHNRSHSGEDSPMEDSSCDGASPPDWSQISSLWPEHEIDNAKPYMDMMDFIDPSSLHMDMNFNPSMAVEPSALHFDPMKFNITQNYPYDLQLPSYSNDLLAPQFPFTFEAPYNPSFSTSSASPQLLAQSRRRLSITSSSSSSGASLSSVSDSISTSEAPLSTSPTDHTQNPPAENQPVKHINDPLAELGERVRQTAGVMLALPMAAHLQAQMSQQAPSPSTPNAVLAPKLPIPRLQQRAAQSVKSPSTVSSAASTPPPSTPSPPPESAQAALPRPKTSHTTIERRYRTNLNARIQSLRMAVPALRVVEDREGKKKAPNKVLVGAEGVKLEVGVAQDVVGPGGVIDVIDERGFVDGVKVARKCSKANVLAKAVEYIRVLKNREHRLKAEQAGLKSLISGLVGGPALLREWEREWKEIFGGAEKDEVDGEADGEADDEDSDDEQDDADEENGRKRKRVKTAAAPAAGAGAKKEKEKKVTPEPNGAAPEKRKRGRPRKIIPVVPAQPVPQQSQDGMSSPQNQNSAPQYLLATFALFSFFNSPLTSSSLSTSLHTHSGTVLNAPIEIGVPSWGLQNYIQTFHFLVSVIVLLSFMASWVGFSFDGNSLLSFLRRRNVRREKRTKAFWTKLGEQCVLGGARHVVPLYTRIQIYHHISTSSSAGVEHLSTAAMALYGSGGILGRLAKTKARTTWTKARAKAQIKGGAVVYERMVLEELNVDEAVNRISHVAEKDTDRSPIQLLAIALVKERVRGHLGSLFIGTIRKDTEDSEYDADKTENENADRRKTIEAAKELGGHVGELGRTLDRVWKLGRNSLVEVPDIRSDESGIDGDIQALLTALVLFQQVFSSPFARVSAKPSDSMPKDRCYVTTLRKALGSRVFEEWDGLEDAKDQAVDMVVELERRSVGLD